MTPRYLSFSEEQQKRSPNPLEDYSLSGSEILPGYFGRISAVNIFLGENNSGKSRFMRDIMRDEQSRLINAPDCELICSQSAEISSVVDNVDRKYILDISLNVIDGMQFRSDEVARIFQIDPLNPAVTSILTSKLFAHLKNIASEVCAIVGYDKSFCSVFFSDEATKIIQKITEIENQLQIIVNVFRSISPKGSIGDNFNQHYTGNGYTIGFRTSSSFVQFSKYPWGDTYSADDREEYADEAREIFWDVKQTVALFRILLENILSTSNNPTYRTYIPTLRTARTLITQEGGRLESTNDIFLHTTVHDYDLKETGVVVDTGFGLYDAIDTTRNARHEGRTTFKDFERFLSATFFNGKDVEVVAERVRDQRGGNIIVAVEGVERDIHHLGDGIQAIIMLLYPLFIAPEKAWFFIEEPEVHMHPGFQRLFIETITSNPVLQAKQLTIFLTTHSNHLLDFALDDPSHVSIFTFRRREGTGSKSTYQIQLSSQRDIENLNTLGVQNTSVFLANCSIWVEGISDRLYFRAYLQAYLAELTAKQGKTVSLLEGLHYTFLEYAGGNVTHFDFATQDGPFTLQTIEDIKALSISNRILLVADRDAGKDTRHQATESKQHNAFKYEILPVREVENLLSPALLAKGLKKLYSSRDFDPAQLIQADYRTSYIGKYLQDQYGGFPASFTADSGTIKNKRKLAEVISPGLTWAEMSPAAQKFTKTLYDFIIAHNPRLGSN